MSRCECGAELGQTDLRCSACGRRFTLDASQTGDVESTRAVDWDAELDRLTRGELRQARVEVAPRLRRRWWQFWRRASRPQ